MAKVRQKREENQQRLTDNSKQYCIFISTSHRITFSIQNQVTTEGNWSITLLRIMQNLSQRYPSKGATHHWLGALLRDILLHFKLALFMHQAKYPYQSLRQLHFISLRYWLSAFQTLGQASKIPVKPSLSFPWVNELGNECFLHQTGSPPGSSDPQSAEIQSPTWSGQRPAFLPCVGVKP